MPAQSPNADQIQASFNRFLEDLQGYIQAEVARQMGGRSGGKNPGPTAQAKVWSKKKLHPNKVVSEPRNEKAKTKPQPTSQPPRVVTPPPQSHKDKPKSAPVSSPQTSNLTQKTDHQSSMWGVLNRVKSKK